MATWMADKKRLGFSTRASSRAGGLVAVVGLFIQFDRVEGQKRDLRPGEEGVEQDKDDLQ